MMVPAPILAWVGWQLLLARLFYGGVFQPGLTWIEGTAEAVSVLVAALVAPARKREVAAVLLGFYVCRDVMTTLMAPDVVTPLDAAVAIAMVFVATAIVWWRCRSSAPPKSDGFR